MYLLALIIYLFLSIFFFLQTLVECHPSGINTHTSLSIPDHVSKEARSLIQQVFVFYSYMCRLDKYLIYLICSGAGNVKTESY